MLIFMAPHYHAEEREWELITTMKEMLFMLEISLSLIICLKMQGWCSSQYISI